MTARKIDFMNKKTSLDADDGNTQSPEDSPNGERECMSSRGANHNIAFIELVELVACGLKKATIEFDRAVLTKKIKGSTWPVYGRGWISFEETYIETACREFYRSIEELAGNLATAACIKAIETSWVINKTYHLRKSGCDFISDHPDDAYNLWLKNGNKLMLLVA
jgi:hypothetical protein